MKAHTLEQARKKLGHIVTNAAEGQASLITYHGVPAAVVISTDAYQRMRGIPIDWSLTQYASSDDCGSAVEGHRASPPSTPGAAAST